MKVHFQGVGQRSRFRTFVLCARRRRMWHLIVVVSSILRRLGTELLTDAL